MQNYIFNVANSGETRSMLSCTPLVWLIHNYILEAVACRAKTGVLYSTGSYNPCDLDRLHKLIVQNTPIEHGPANIFV